MALDDRSRGRILEEGSKSHVFENIIEEYVKPGKLIPKENLERIIAVNHYGTAEAEMVRKVPDRELHPVINEGYELAQTSLAEAVQDDYSEVLSGLEAGGITEEGGIMPGPLGTAVLGTPGNDDENDEIGKSAKEYQEWKQASENGDIAFYIEKADPILRTAIKLYKEEAKEAMKQRAQIEGGKVLIHFTKEDDSFDGEAMKQYLNRNISGLNDEDKQKAYAVAGKGYFEQANMEEAQRRATAQGNST